MFNLKKEAKLTKKIKAVARKMKLLVEKWENGEHLNNFEKKINQYYSGKEKEINEQIALEVFKKRFENYQMAKLFLIEKRFSEELSQAKRIIKEENREKRISKIMEIREEKIQKIKNLSIQNFLPERVTA